MGKVEELKVEIANKHLHGNLTELDALIAAVVEREWRIVDRVWDFRTEIHREKEKGKSLRDAFLVVSTEAGIGIFDKE